MSRSMKRAAVQSCPIPGNSPSDRKDYPDFKSPQESLHRCPPARSIHRLAFSRHGGIYRSDGVPTQNLGAGAASRWSAPSPSKGRHGRNYASCSSSTMSSGRLFLDRVARQHSPPPLHRQLHPKTVPGWGTMKGQRTVNSVLTVCLSRGDNRRMAI